MPLASSAMPSIHQVYNSCGISCVLMALKPDKNHVVDAFLRALEKKVTKSMKIDPMRYDFLDRVQFAAAWLVLRAVFTETTLLDMVAPVLPDIENVRPVLESRLDEMVVYQKASNNQKIEKDHAKLLERGDITQNLLAAYIQEHKTDVELKLLGALLGLSYKAVPEQDGGTPLGMVGPVDPEQPDTYARTVHTLARQLATGAVLANYEYHWLALREIGTREENIAKNGASSQVTPGHDASSHGTSDAPHYFKFNNPLSGSTITVRQPDVLQKYMFYLFDFNPAQQQRCIDVLESTLKL
ncbi:MAG: hypothetical protein GYA24_11040 [Candidatus Lokiarchaeota archaeon]|nr:hypothetical protein [Candidatus Lokiarchaeota archaeon]